MFKRLPIISIVICAIAVICGLIFMDVDAKFNERQNGPPLVTPGFEKRVRNAHVFDENFYKKYKIRSGAYGEDLKSLWRDGFTIRNQIDSNEADLLIVTKLSDSQFYLKIPRYDISDKGWLLKKSRKETFAGQVTIAELNRIIDKRVFPNLKTRKQKKMEILKRIDELNKLAEEERKLVPGYKKQRKSPTLIDTRHIN